MGAQIYHAAESVPRERGASPTVLWFAFSENFTVCRLLPSYTLCKDALLQFLTSTHGVSVRTVRTVRAFAEWHVAADAYQQSHAQICH